MVGGPRPTEPLPEDAPENHEVVGVSFLLSASEMLPVLEAASAEFGDVVRPPKFRPLRLSAHLAIVHTMQPKRTTLPPGEDPIPLAFLSNGTYIAPEATLDTCWLNSGHVVDREKVIIIDLHALPHPRIRGYENRPSVDEAKALALHDVEELCRWFTDDVGRCWRAGSTWPRELTDDEAVGEALSARVRRQISRGLRGALDDLPQSFLEQRPTLRFLSTGECLGMSNDILGTEHVEEDHLVRVRISPDSDHADIDDFLDKIRVNESGRVTVLP